MVVHGRASLVSDFKFTRENNDLLFSGHKYIFEVPDPVHEYTKVRIPNKDIKLKRLVLFEAL